MTSIGTRLRAMAAGIVAALLLATTAPTASAAPLEGHDVSWPQCSEADGGYDLPMPPAGTDFVIIGLTKGLAFTENPCIDDQVDWVRDRGVPAHGYAMATFPTDAQLSTYGRSGPWPGSDRASRLRNVGAAEARFAVATLDRVGWDPDVVWVDVEPRPAQPWPTGTTARQENRYVVEGVLRGLRDAGYATGLYSYANGWTEIVGSWRLLSVPVWATAGVLDYPGEALDRCKPPTFSGGPAYLAQWTDRVRDFNITCGSYAFTPLPLRWWGEDRYGTSAASSATVGAGVSTVYVASGDDYPDALSAAAAAGARGAPVLLVRSTQIPAEVAAELGRLRPGRIVVTGGTDVVSSGVATALDAYTTGPVTRISGVDRYATAAAVSRATVTAGVDTVYVASGEAFPDALAGAAVAGAAETSVLLVRQGSIPSAVASELERLNPARIVVLGGESAVSATVASRLASYTSGAVTRVAGSDRYETAARLARTVYPSGAETVFVASGQTFPDALSGAAAAAEAGAPVLLVRRDRVPSSVGTAVRLLTPEEAVVLGGHVAVADVVYRWFSAALG